MKKIDIRAIRQQWLSYALGQSKYFTWCLSNILAGTYGEKTWEYIDTVSEVIHTTQEVIDRLHEQGILPDDRIVFPDWLRFFGAALRLRFPDWKLHFIKGKRPYQVRRFIWELYKTEMQCPDMPRKFFTGCI